VTATTRPAVFLDRDGTIIEDKGFLSDPDGVDILATVPEALKLLADRGYATFVVSNQSGIARGYFDDTAVERVNAEIVRRLADDGVAIDAWYWCSHYDDGCDCRKPEPGLVQRAMNEHPIDLAHSAVVGDRGSDVELGQRLGMAGILVPGPLVYTGPEPDFRAKSLIDAAEWIVRRGH
jgi:D-glycero-D-manno-heptose 1,7-bisphosphate phosphatase